MFADHTSLGDPFTTEDITSFIDSHSSISEEDKINFAISEESFNGSQVKHTPSTPSRKALSEITASSFRTPPRRGAESVDPFFIDPTTEFIDMHPHTPKGQTAFSNILQSSPLFQGFRSSPVFTSNGVAHLLPFKNNAPKNQVKKHNFPKLEFEALACRGTPSSRKRRMKQSASFKDEVENTPARSGLKRKNIETLTPVSKKLRMSYSMDYCSEEHSKSVASRRLRYKNLFPSATAPLRRLSLFINEQTGKAEIKDESTKSQVVDFPPVKTASPVAKVNSTQKEVKEYTFKQVEFKPPVQLSEQQVAVKVHHEDDDDDDDPLADEFLQEIISPVQLSNSVTTTPMSKFSSPFRFSPITPKDMPVESAFKSTTTQSSFDSIFPELASSKSRFKSHMPLIVMDNEDSKQSTFYNDIGLKSDARDAFKFAMLNRVEQASFLVDHHHEDFFY